jgi:transcriptional regulator with XRE-family HTH domain
MNVAQPAVETFGDRLRHTRIFRDYSLGKLAERAEVSKGYIWQLESSHKVASPSIAMAHRLAAALGVDPAWLAGWTRDGDPALAYDPDAAERGQITRPADIIRSYRERLDAAEEALERISEMNPSTAMMGAPDVARAAKSRIAQASSPSHNTL